jgi:arylsulfatase A
MGHIPLKRLVRWTRLSLLCYFISPLAGAAADRPNVLLVIADDLGYGDLGCFGHHEIATPNLDQLAAAGVKLTSYYAAAPVCSPARAGLLTGRTPARAGIHGAIPMLSPMHLRASEVTIATLLKKAGYATAQVGKWHLNGMFDLPGQPQPRDHGFEYSFAVQNNALPNHHNPYNFVRNGIPVGRLTGYSGPIVADEAVHWLTEVRDKSKPFFLYVAFNEPHEPIATDPQFRAPYDKRHPDDPSRAAYYGNVAQMDAALGRILDALQAQGLADNTLVWFTSDNGPARTLWHNVGSSGGLREFKGHLYEGGIRVPGIIRWPRHGRAGSVAGEVVCGVDVLPTLCEITGIALRADRTLDGASIVPLFSGQPVMRPKPLYWQYVMARSKPQVALRLGNWKVLASFDGRRPSRSGRDNEAFHDLIKKARLTGFELYDLEADPAESTNLAERRPEKLVELQAALAEYHASVQADAPVWPPFDDPGYEKHRIEWPSYRAKPLPGKKRAPAGR